jgi:hypothetical protein
MKKRWLWYIVGSLALVFIIGFYYYNKPVPGLDNLKAVYAVNAQTLYNEYEENEGIANGKYLNQVIEVKGTVNQVSRQKIQLETSSMFGIICEMAPESDETQITIGDQITCRGVCTGKLMDVVLTRCIVIN